MNALSLGIKLLSEFCDNWERGQPAYLLFEEFVPLLNSKLYHGCLKDGVENVLEKILNFKRENLKMLVLEKKRPKPLRLYEPNIEEV